MLGQFTGQEKTYSSLDLSAGDGGTSVVVSQTGSLSSNTLEDVIHKRVHDGHSLAGDTCVRVNLLHHFVDVDSIALPPPPVALLVPTTCSLGLAGGLLCSFGCWFRWHVVVCMIESDNDCTKKFFPFIRTERSGFAKRAGIGGSQSDCSILDSLAVQNPTALGVYKEKLHFTKSLLVYILLTQATIKNVWTW